MLTVYKATHETYLAILYLHTDRLRFTENFFYVQFHREFIYVL